MFHPLFYMYRIPHILARVLKPWVTLAYPGTSEALVYLTFDDGPDPEFTPVLLQSLRKYNAQATFFPVGSEAAKYPELIEQIRAEGHSVHLHSWSHNRAALKKTRVFQTEMVKSQELIRSHAYRPPYGKIRLIHLVWLIRNHYRVILWNVDPCDYAPGKYSLRSFSKLLNHIRPGDIILLHNKKEFSDLTLKITINILESLSGKNGIFEKIH